MNNFIVSLNPLNAIKSVEEKFYKTDLPVLFVGDTIKIGILIKEGNKERTQYYEGIVIAQQNTGLNKTLTVRRIMQGIGIERVFLIHSPKLVGIEVKRSSQVRKAKLYFLRGLSGKASRLKQKFN